MRQPLFGFMEKIKLAVISDLHYFSSELGTSGSAYERRSNTDHVYKAETAAICDKAFAEIAKSDCEAVLIVGDISNDGEAASHREIINKLKKLQESKPVFTVYATHDWCCDGRARRFVGSEEHFDVETVSPEELRQLYHEFGAARALSEYVNPNGSSSYCAEIAKGLRLLAINDDKNGKGKAGYTEEHLAWIIEQIRAAERDKVDIIAMQHHLLMPNVSRLVNGGQLIGDDEEMTRRLAEEGLSFIFVGHSHMQRISRFTAENDNILYQINIGSLSGYPCPYTYFTIDREKAVVDVHYLDGFSYNGVLITPEMIRGRCRSLVLGVVDAAAEGKSALGTRLANMGIDSVKLPLGDGAIRRIGSLLQTLTVGRAGTVVNLITLGRGIDRQALSELKDEPLLYYIGELCLSCFDGSRHKFPEGSAVNRVVSSVASLPRRALRLLPIKKTKKERLGRVLGDIEHTAKELCSPAFDNQYDVLYRKSIR